MYNNLLMYFSSKEKSMNTPYLNSELLKGAVHDGIISAYFFGTGMLTSIIHHLYLERSTHT